MRHWTPLNIEINYPPLSDLGITLEQARLLQGCPFPTTLKVEISEINQISSGVYRITVYSPELKMYQTYEALEEPDPEAVEVLESLVAEDDQALTELLEGLDEDEISSED